METIKELKHDILRSMFQAMTKSDFIKRKRGIANKLCYHLVRLVAYPNDISANHWYKDEIVVWLYDYYSGVTLKNGSNKNHTELIEPIYSYDEEVDINHISDMIDELKDKYGTPLYTPEEIGDIIEIIFSEKVLNGSITYSKKGSREQLDKWYEKVKNKTITEWMDKS